MTLFFRPSIACWTSAGRDHRTRRGLLTVCLSVALGAGAVSSVSAEQWTDVSGKKTIEAKFVGVMGERAILELPNGKRSAVPLRDLQYESRQRALDMEQARQKHMATLTSELERAVEKELEAAPKRIPPAESAPPEYEPLPEKATLEQTAQHLAGQLQAGHLRVFWDVLPPSYQTDVEEVVVEFADQMDPVIWDDMLRSVTRITELLASRERWIFSYPALENAGVDEPLRDGYRAFLGALQTICDPDVLTLQRLKEGNLEELIAERDALLAPYLDSLIALAEGESGIDPSQIEVAMIDDNRGMVTFKPPAADDPSGPEGSSPAPTPENVPPSGPGYPSPGQGAPSAGPGPGYASPGPGYGSPGYPSPGPGYGPPGYPSPGSPSQDAGKPQMFVLVEGRWIPEEMAKQWDPQIEALKGRIKNELPAQLAALRPRLDAFKEAIDQYVGPLEEAGSEAEFHAGIDRLAVQAAGFAFQAFGRMNPGNRSGGNPYGSAMGMGGYGPAMEMPGYSGTMQPYGEDGNGGSTQSRGNDGAIPGQPGP